MGDKANKISLYNIQELFWLFVAHRTCPEGFLCLLRNTFSRILFFGCDVKRLSQLAVIERRCDVCHLLPQKDSSRNITIWAELVKQGPIE